MVDRNSLAALATRDVHMGQKNAIKCAVHPSLTYYIPYGGPAHTLRVHRAAQAVPGLVQDEVYHHGVSREEGPFVFRLGIQITTRCRPTNVNASSARSKLQQRSPAHAALPRCHRLHKSIARDERKAGRVAVLGI
jgi:hypothetical protein